MGGKSWRGKKVSSSPLFTLLKRSLCVCEVPASPGRRSGLRRGNERQVSSFSPPAPPPQSASYDTDTARIFAITGHPRIPGVGFPAFILRAENTQAAVGPLHCAALRCTSCGNPPVGAAPFLDQRLRQLRMRPEPAGHKLEGSSGNNPAQF